MRAVIVRSHLAGVFFGYLVGTPTADRIKLKASRRIYSWRGALCVETLATIGPGEGSRITDEVDQIIFGQIVQVLTVTPEAETCFKSFPVSR